jgi:hypothetical protein
MVDSMGAGPGESATPKLDAEGKPIVEAVAAAAPAPDGAQPAPELNADGTPKVAKPEPTEAEKRIQRLVAERKEAEELAEKNAREAEYYKGLAEGRTPKPSPEKPVPPAADTAPAPPDVTKYEKYEDYERAKETYLVEKAKYEIRQEAKADAEKKKKEAVDRTWNEKVAAAATKHADFQRVIGNPAFVQSDPVAFLIKDSEIGGELAYYLGTHLDVTAKLNALPPHVVAKEIGKIEAQLLTPKAEPQKNIISQAPEPIKTVAGAGPTAEVDEQDLPMEEFAKRRNAKEFGKRAA